MLGLSIFFYIGTMIMGMVVVYLNHKLKNYGLMTIWIIIMLIQTLSFILGLHAQGLIG